jgi:TPR repeat protein
MKPAPCLFLILTLLASPPAMGDPIGELAAKAEAGDAAAQAGLGAIYAKGEGVAKDVTAALKWLTAAADQGNNEAQMMLGGMYIAGRGVRKSSSEAAKWYMQSALNGHAAAQCQVARMCMAGAGVPKDDVEAYKWAVLAATQGDVAAKQIVAFLTPKLPPEKVVEGKKRAQDFVDLRKADLMPELPENSPMLPVEPAPPINPE